MKFKDPDRKLFQEHSFPSKYITEVEKDGRTYNTSTSMSSTTKVIDEWLGSQDYGDRDVIDSLRVLQYVCALVSERCAVLASVCVAELCSRNNKVKLLGHSYCHRCLCLKCDAIVSDDLFHDICSDDFQEIQTVAVDGSVFKHHPFMKQRMTHYINTFAATKKVLLTK